MKYGASRRGLTLLELLVVVSILSALAMSALTITERADSQSRFDLTLNRRNLARESIVMDPTLRSAGRVAAAGFAADMGRLPSKMSELVELGSQAEWEYNPQADQWAGWRGPYLSAPPETTSGLRAFRDGWGNVSLLPLDDLDNFGWLWSFDPSRHVLSLQTMGADALDDSSSSSGSGLYEKDWPEIDEAGIVVADDYLADLKGWSVWVELRNNLGSPVTLPNKLRLRVYYPAEDGDGNVEWPRDVPGGDGARDAAEFLSLDKPTGGATLGSGGVLVLQFFFGANVSKPVPCGLRTIVVYDDSDSEDYNPDDNTPLAITLIPRTALPASSSQSPLIRWEAD